MPLWPNTKAFKLCWKSVKTNGHSTSKTHVLPCLLHTRKYYRNVLLSITMEQRWRRPEVLCPRISKYAGSKYRAVQGVGLPPLASRDCGLWIRPGAWLFVCCECCVLSGRGLYGELITRPEKSYQMWCIFVCELEISRMWKPWPALGRSVPEGEI